MCGWVSVRHVALTLAVTAVSPVVDALDNGLGRTPPLGWSSWNYFANHVNETVIMDVSIVTY